MDQVLNFAICATGVAGALLLIDVHETLGLASIFACFALSIVNSIALASRKVALQDGSTPTDLLFSTMRRHASAWAHTITRRFWSRLQSQNRFRR
jgi:hypothetical protein